jgi:hypothetical protein
VSGVDSPSSSYAESGSDRGTSRSDGEENDESDDGPPPSGAISKRPRLPLADVRTLADAQQVRIVTLLYTHPNAPPRQLGQLHSGVIVISMHSLVAGRIHTCYQCLARRSTWQGSGGVTSCTAFACCTAWCLDIMDSGRPYSIFCFLQATRVPHNGQGGRRLARGKGLPPNSSQCF